MDGNSSFALLFLYTKCGGTGLSLFEEGIGFNFKECPRKHTRCEQPCDVAQETFLKQIPNPDETELQTK